MKQEEFNKELIGLRPQGITGYYVEDLHMYYDVPKSSTGRYRVIPEEDFLKLLGVQWGLGRISQYVYGGKPGVPQELSSKLEYINYLVWKAQEGLGNETRGD